MSDTGLKTTDEPKRTVPWTAKGPRKRYIDLVKGPAARNIAYEMKPAGYELVRRMSRGGRDFSSIAAALGVSTDWFAAQRRNNRRVQEALDVGRGELGDELTDILLEQARNGIFTAAIFLAKARCGWREGELPEGARPSVNVNIQIPPAMTDAEFAKVVNGEAVVVETEAVDED